MKYTVTEYSEGTETKVFEGSEDEVFEYLVDSEYYTFLNESEAYTDRMEYAAYQESLEDEGIENIYLPDYNWYKLEITDEGGNVVNETKNPGTILAVVQTKDGYKDAVCIGDEGEIVWFLMNNAYSLYYNNLEYEYDPEKMKKLISEYDDSEELIEEDLKDGMSEEEALKDVYKTYVDGILQYVKRTIQKSARNDTIAYGLGVYGFYGLEIERR